MKDRNRLDDPETTIHHGELIKRKRFLKYLYEEWYQGFIAEQSSLPVSGKILELGSGGGFIKDLLPEIITSDVMYLPGCDIKCFAESLPFKNDELKAIFMLDVLHHIPESRKFFKEASRTLNKGGIIYMIEPANTLFSRFIYKNLHHEVFDENAENWSFESSGPLSGSNQALPWIIFDRDRKVFEKEFQELRIKNLYLHTPLRYLVSGGLSFNTRIPSWSFGFFRSLEGIVRPWNRFFAMFQTIVVEKV